VTVLFLLLFSPTLSSLFSFSLPFRVNSLLARPFKERGAALHRNKKNSKPSNYAFIDKLPRSSHSRNGLWFRHYFYEFVLWPTLTSQKNSPAQEYSCELATLPKYLQLPLLFSFSLRCYYDYYIKIYARKGIKNSIVLICHTHSIFRFHLGIYSAFSCVALRIFFFFFLTSLSCYPPLHNHFTTSSTEKWDRFVWLVAPKQRVPCCCSTMIKWNELISFRTFE